MKLETIKRTIERFHEVKSDDSYMAAIMQLRFYYDQNGEFYIWADDSEEGKMEPYALRSDNGDKWFPVFTGKETIEPHVDEGVIIPMGFKEILSFVNDEIVGIMIDPWNASCPIMKEEYESWKNQ